MKIIPTRLLLNFLLIIWVASYGTTLWAQTDFEPTDVQIVQTGSTIRSHRVGFFPPTDTTGLSAYLIFYSEREKPEIVNFIGGMTRAEIENLDTAAVNSARLITNLSYADGGGNSFYTDQVDVITGESFMPSERSYHVYAAALSDTGVLGSDVGSPGIAEANMTIGQAMDPQVAMEAVNVAADAGDVVPIIDAMQILGWTDFTSDQQLTVAQTVFNGRPYDDVLFFRSVVENEIFLIKAPSGMDAVNATNDPVEIRSALAAMNPPNWGNLSGTAQGVNVPDVVLYLKAQSGGQFTALSDFVAAVRAGLSMGSANDNNYYSRELRLYVEHFSLMNPYQYNHLPVEQKYTVASVIKFENGLDSSGYPILYPEDDPGGFVAFLSEMVTSISTAAQHPVSIGGPHLEMGVTAQLTGAVDPGANETRVYFTSDGLLAAMDLNGGSIDPLAAGNVTVGFSLFNTDQRTISGFGAGTYEINDTVPPVGSIYEPEAGGIHSLLIRFNENLHADTYAISDIANFASSIVISGGLQQDVITIASSENSVNWITDRIAKITFPSIVLYEGNVITIQYTADVKDISVNPADPTVTGPAVPDTVRPMGKVLTPALGTMDSITVVFNETLSPYTKSITNVFRLIRRIRVLGGETQASIDPVSIAWTQVNGRDAAVITIAPVEMVRGNYLKVKWSRRVRDLAGNRVNNMPSVIPIGGALASDNDEIYQAIRRAAGGKNPVIAVIGSSRTDLANALDRFNDLFSGYSAMTLASQGFEPLFIPIAVDNYLTAAQDPANVALMDQAHATLLMGGSQMRHARCFLEDDLTDSPLMTAMRSIYSSGGAISGSSAGDHILGEFIHGGGTSWGDLSHNGMIQNTIHDPLLGDSANQQSGIGPGFGFLARYNAITDSHFGSRGRLGRMIVAMRETDKNLGIGVDDNTAIVFKGRTAKVYGENGVIIFNARHAMFGNGEQFTAEGLRLHYLTSGDRYLVNWDRVISSKWPIFWEDGEVYNSADIFGSYEIRDVLTALVESRARDAFGTTEEQDPGFTLFFSKKGYINGFEEDGLYTVRNISLSIEPN